MVRADHNDRSAEVAKIIIKVLKAWGYTGCKGKNQRAILFELVAKVKIKAL